MKWTLASMALVASSAKAIPAPAGHAYVAPGAGDVRSPCPGLNSLANHAFIPHSGMNITLPVLIAGLQNGLSVAADFGSTVGALALASSPNRGSTTFNLNDLDEHNFPIEHDGSLSRQDYYSGNDHSFYQPNFNTVLSYYEGQTVTTLKPAAAARWARVQNSNQTNPTFTYGIQQFILSYGETALYMQCMSNPVTGDAPIAFVKSLFEQERLPYELGWQPSTVPITLASLGLMITELHSVSPDANAENFYITENSYKDILDDLAALAGERNPTLGG